MAHGLAHWTKLEHRQEILSQKQTTLQSSRLPLKGKKARIQFPPNLFLELMKLGLKRGLGAKREFMANLQGNFSISKGAENEKI